MIGLANFVASSSIPENPSVEEEDFSILVKKLRRYINENRQSHETEPNTCPKGGRYITVVVRASINCSSNEKKIANNQLHGVQDADATQRRPAQSILSIVGLYSEYQAVQRYNYLEYHPKALTNTRMSQLQYYCDPHPTTCLHHAYLSCYLVVLFLVGRRQKKGVTRSLIPCTYPDAG